MGAAKKTLDLAGSAEQLLVLSFEVAAPEGRIACAMNIHKVREVVECRGLSPLPAGYAPFVGVHDLRGCPVPVMPLEAVFRTGTAFDASRPGRVLVVELQGKRIGLLVAGTGRILSFRGDEVLEPPAALAGIKGQFFNGMLRGASGYLYLLDLEGILDAFGISLDGEVSTQAEKPLFAGKRVLVVEDSRLYQKKIQAIFAAWGCELFFAANGREALEVLEGRKGDVDLIFTDIEMPTMNGIELAVKVKASPAFGRIPLVFNSSLSNPMLIEEVKEKALGGYIVKFDQAAIRAEVARALGGEK